MLILVTVSVTAVGQDNIPQQKIERSFTGILELFNGGNYQAVIPAVHTFAKDFGRSTRYEPELEYFEGISASRLSQKDAEQKLTNFTRQFSGHTRVTAAEFEIASIYYRGRNYQKAAEKLSSLDFRKFSRSQDTEARFMLGYSYFNLKRLPEALDQFNFIKASDNIYAPAASYYSGYIELSLGAYVDALRDLQRIEKQSSYSDVVPYLIAQVYNKQGKDDELIRYAATLQEQQSIQNLDEINLLASEAYFRKKNYAKALEGYNDYLKGKSSTDRSIYFRAGFANFSAGKPNEAIEYLKRAASDKDSIGVYASYYLGISYLKTGQKPLALTAFQISQRFDKDPKLQEESAFQAAKLLYDLGRADEAIDQMEGFQNRYSGSEHGNEMGELLSSAYVNARSYHKAITHIENISKRTPATDKAYQRAAYLYGTELFNKNDYAQAIQYFNKSLNFPFDESYAAKAALWAGESLSASGDWEKAASYYDRTLNYKPDKAVLVQARYGQGYVRYNQQYYERALYSFKEYVNNASSNDPNLANGYVRLADCYYVSKQYQDALNNYKKAYSLNRSDLDYAHLQAGVISGILRLYKEGITELEVVVRSFPNSPYWDEAIFQKGQIEFETGNYAAANASYSRLMAVKPSSRFVPFAYSRRAATNFNLKQYRNTANDYIVLLNQYPNHPATKDVLLPLQEALNLAGNAGEFENHLKKYKQQNPEAKGLENVEFETAKNMYLSQEYNKAISGLTSFISEYPQSPKITEAKYYKAEAYYRIKDSQNALETYREIWGDETFLFANRIAGRVAELEFKLGRYEQAVDANKKLARLSVNAKERYSSWTGLMDSYFLINSFDSCTLYANKLLNDAGVATSTQNKAALMLGKIAMAKGDYENAKDEFLMVVNNASDEYGAEAKYRIGEIQYLTKAYKQSYETLIALNKDYSAYPIWVGKAFLLLADDFVGMNEIFQAKATLKSLEQFPDQMIVDQARIKLRQIEESESKKEETVKKDSTEN